MKFAPIIHQQIVQLKWHLLACTGLMMALPMEDAIVNLWQGQGFYAGSLSLAVPLVASPLLAALVACANVQADFDDRRYTFCRSKPAGIKSWVLLKYVIGLLAAFAIIALPFLFAFITCRLVEPDEIERGFFEAVIMVQSVSLLTYSLCFLCNVLIRKIARAWLVGMALTCFLMIIPFILPLNLRTIDDVFNLLGKKWSFIWAGYCLTVVPSLAVFILSIIAASRDWRLHTNLKGLLWIAAASVFLLMLLFSRQIANIKVLDQKTCELALFKDYWNEELLLLHEKFGIEINSVEVVGNKIHLRPVTPPLTKIQQEYRRLLSGTMYKVDPELKLRIVPSQDSVDYKTPNALYTFRLYAYYKKQESTDGTPVDRRVYKNIYLHSFRVVNGLPLPISYIDLSDCLHEQPFYNMDMRVIGNKIIALVGRQCVSISVSDSGEMTLLSKQPAKGYRVSAREDEKMFKIPLFPTEAISIQERIRFSVDWQYLGLTTFFQKHSIVDDAGGKLSFVLVSYWGIARYDVVDWDVECVYCRLRDTRPFTFLEKMFSQIQESYCFVQDGKFYAYGTQKLLIFDIRSEYIRKLGHFERVSADFSIRDIEVLKDGNIMIDAVSKFLKHEDGRRSTIYKLFLLENPE